MVLESSLQLLLEYQHITQVAVVVVLLNHQQQKQDLVVMVAAVMVVLVVKFLHMALKALAAVVEAAVAVLNLVEMVLLE